VTWFFETFLLTEFNSGYKPFRNEYDFIFNSYYYTHGEMHPRPQRGMLSRPTVEEVSSYRQYVDEHMISLIERTGDDDWVDLKFRVTLGLHHEQQHQELLLMDVKHNFSVNPLMPIYRTDLDDSQQSGRQAHWFEKEGGIYSIGHSGNGFAFDNETPRHDVMLRPYRISDRFINNTEYLQFIEDGGYSNPALWLSDGWTLINHEGWQHPLYWQKRDGDWEIFTLGGTRKMADDEPVCHLSFYEADAYARWAGKRLPTEAELEIVLAEHDVSGNFVEAGRLHPAVAGEEAQWYGDLWAWTASPYMAYPGFKPLDGSMGEYNGKFMSNQMVLKGGSCITSRDHTRANYRNFFYPNERWAFTGLRLAEDVV
jgi:ergothioneine biosynthesis protein EgtB